MRHGLLTLLALALVSFLALSGCGSAPNECVTDLDCDGVLQCTAGSCQRPDCEVGTVGCACSAGMRCGRAADGSSLVCGDNGVCDAVSCVSGSTSCACIAGEGCTAEDDECTAGYCTPSDCNLGAVGCGCVAGTCDIGAWCLDDALCVDSAGYEGGVCHDSTRCNRGYQCDTTLDACVFCEFGSEGCGCRETGDCNGGLACVADLCVDASTVAPTSAQCFTPCRSDLEGEDGARVCDDGLMEGCIDDQVCTRGSCVAPGDTKATCTESLECPYYQTCLQDAETAVFGCFSNCETSAECGAGMGCHLHVCRVPCESNAGGADCGTGLFCAAENGSFGYCVPMGAGEPREEGLPSGGLRIEPAHLFLSSGHPSSSFEVQFLDDTGAPAASEALHDVRIRRLWHERLAVDGTRSRVEGGFDAETGESCDACAVALPWLRLGFDDSLSDDAVVHASASGATATLSLEAGDAAASRWTGAIEIIAGGARTIVSLEYVQSAAGQWSGTMVYFGNFPTGGLDRWAANPETEDADAVGNALIRRWGAFRNGSLPGGFNEISAVLTSLETESWRTGGVEERCRSAFPTGACYPYSNSAGFRPLSTNTASAPPPTGATELPISLNLLEGSNGMTLNGRIESGRTLHYPGDPAINIELATDPASSSCGDGEDCVVWFSSLQAESFLPAQRAGADGVCPGGFTARIEPWLVPGFASGSADGDTQTRCVADDIPFEDSDEGLARNRSLASANAPDGRVRHRTLTLLDGAMIDQTRMVILFRERFESFFDAGDGEGSTEALGYMILARSASPELDEASYVGFVPTDSVIEERPSGATCDSTLVSAVFPGESRLSALTSLELRSFTEVMQNGSAGTPINPARVHYFCEDTGLFSGGAEDHGGSGAVSIACPEGSRVTYFTSTLSQAEIAGLPCQADVTCSATTCSGGTCQERLTLMRFGDQVDIYEPPYQCDFGADTCDENRFDLRDGKTFYQPGDGGGFSAIQSEIEAAFRYRTRFRSSDGSRPGFAPELCPEDSDRAPYCFAPPQIEEVRGRIDCLLEIRRDDSLSARLDASRLGQLDAFLRGNFSEQDDSRDGFERLYAELLVMLGDEALTRGLASRFDLAAVSGGFFEGSALESNGIDLAGIAGFEMRSLYSAVQHYQLALDRLYELGSDWSATIARSDTVDANNVFISAETVTLYLERLIRASTQKARAYGEIAKRYQGFNRPDLARLVSERGYVSAYLESSIIGGLMNTIAERSRIEDEAQILQVREQSQRRYRLALLGMRDVYASIQDETTFLGIDPDYVPLPVLDASAVGRGPVEFMLQRFASKTALARSREAQALASDRNFQADTASFQRELSRLRNNYDSQLGQICGTFESSNGEVLPATRRYAGESDMTSQLGDPCGRVGNGQLTTAVLSYQVRLNSQRTALLRIQNMFSEIEIERQRVSDQCDEDVALADYQFLRSRRTRNLQEVINETRLTTDLLNQSITAGADLAASLACIPGGATNCINEYIGGGVRFAAAAILATNTGISQSRINDKEAKLLEVQADTAHWSTLARCDMAEIESDSRTASIMLRLQGLELEALRANWASRLAMSEIEQLFNRAQRLQSERTEADSLLVDVESARNDPNVRIYRNDAVLNADIAFEDALRAAYRATRAYEYYTGQSYPGREKLYLIRLVTAGEFNLENYLVELEEDFQEFENCYGARATRVQYLSLMDDIFQIPEIGESGEALSQGERYERLRQRVTSSDLLDADGNLVMGFATELSRLSPLTRLHNVQWIEVEIAGTAGDHVGRVRLRQTGTGVTRNLHDELAYHLLDERNSVVNVFFNGSRVESPEYYRSYTLRGRPLVNTSWELVFDPSDGENRDVQLDTLADIRLYLYYSDYTAGSECR